MRAFVETAMTKPELESRLLQHYRADEIQQGIYWQGGKGCAVGCAIHSMDHTMYERYFGIPVMLAHVEDRIFEGLSPAEAKEWPLRFIHAVPVGADLSQVGPRFLFWVIRHEALPRATLETVVPIGNVMLVLEHWVETGVPDRASAAAAHLATSGKPGEFMQAASIAAGAAVAAADAHTAEVAGQVSAAMRFHNAAGRFAADATWSAAWQTGESDPRAYWSRAAAHLESLLMNAELSPPVKTRIAG
jgi:hypothetical protein